MSDELLPYFERELEFLRDLGAEFARSHPKIAGRLRISQDSVEDPHVARLIQSVALLNARTRRKLDDDFSELAQGILGTVSPHHLRPLPSMSIIRFLCSPDLTGPYQIEAGTQLETDVRYGEPSYFRTVYDTECWPIRIAECSLVGAPFRAPKVAGTQSSASVLRIRLETAEGQCPFHELGMGSLRMFLRGQASVVQDLFEFFLDDVTCVAVASSPDDPDPIVLPKDCLRPVGLDPEDAMFPSDGRTHPGPALLTEYFAFPSKFQFVDLVDLPKSLPDRFEGGMEIFLFAAASDRELEQSVDLESIGLGCTPVINLFQRRADPIELDGRESEVQVIPDARSPDVHEVYSVDSVVAVSRDGERRSYSRFYGAEHSTELEAREAYWHSSRRPSPGGDDGRESGTDVFLSLVDLDGRPSVPRDWVLETDVTCFNRNRAERLPFGGGEPLLRFSDGGGGIETIECLLPFTPTVRPSQGDGAIWRLVSQLSLNHLSVTGEEDGAEALREILRVNDLVDSAVTRNVVGSVESVTSRPSLVRIREGGMLGLVRGVEVRVQLDEARLGSIGAFQFGLILDRFLAASVATNSFVQLVTSSSKSEDGWHRWPPRSGTRRLL